MFETNELLKSLISEARGIRDELEKITDKSLLYGGDDLHEAIEQASDDICGMISAAVSDLQETLNLKSKE